MQMGKAQAPRSDEPGACDSPKGSKSLTEIFPSGKMAHALISVDGKEVNGMRPTWMR